MACATCHGGANFDASRVPGNPHWALAPVSMAWEGKTLGEICVQLKDPRRNGKAWLPSGGVPYFSQFPCAERRMMRQSDLNGREYSSKRYTNDRKGADH
jgi:hypothetical protein